MSGRGQIWQIQLRLNFLDYRRCGNGVLNREQNDLAAVLFGDGGGGELVGGVVSGLDVKIRLDDFDIPGVAAFGEEEDVIDAFESGDEGGTMVLRHNGARGAFVLAHGVVGVDGDDEAVAQGACALDVVNVSGMKDVKCAGGEADGFALGFEGAADVGDLIARKNFGGGGSGHGGGA